MNLQHVLGQVIDPHGCTLWVGFTFAFACAHDAHRADDKPVFSRKLPEGRNQSKVFFHMFKHVRNWNNCLDIATEALGNRAFLFAEGAGHQRIGVKPWLPMCSSRETVTTCSWQLGQTRLLRPSRSRPGRGVQFVLVVPLLFIVFGIAGIAGLVNIFVSCLVSSFLTHRFSSILVHNLLKVLQQVFSELQISRKGP